MLQRRSFTIARGQVATSKPSRYGTKLRMTYLLKGSNQRHCTGQTIQGLGSSGLGELWTQKQGSVIGRTSNLQYPSRSFRNISPQRRKGLSFPTERRTSWLRPSGILSTLDEHEAHQAPFRGWLGSPAVVVTRAERERGK